jgi:hypothetical protein
MHNIAGVMVLDQRQNIYMIFKALFLLFCFIGAERMATAGTLDPDTDPNGLEWTQKVINFQHGCGINVLGILYCWGENDGGQVGNGRADYYDVAPPTQVQFPVKHPGKIIKVDLGSYFTCALSEFSKLYCFGIHTGLKINTAQPTEITFQDDQQSGPIDIVNFEVGYIHFCAISAQGRVFCSVSSAHSKFNSELPLKLVRFSDRTMNQVIYVNIENTEHQITCVWVADNLGVAEYCWKPADFGLGLYPQFSRWIQDVGK